MTAPILTVVYHENKEHYKMALKTWASLPKDWPKLAVMNLALSGVEYPNDITYIANNENCLARAWNLGLTRLFDDSEYVFLSNLDCFAPSEDEMLEMYRLLVSNPEYGMVSCIQSQSPLNPVKHGDGSFSFFLLSSRAYYDVGAFDERYKPAYFEDCDYLERLWGKGYKPISVNSKTYMHIGQGTLKAGDKVKKDYPAFMQKNLETFKETYGKVPDHLPVSVSFL